MKIACLQFAPKLGDVSKNVERADAMLDEGIQRQMDILILPELAFSGTDIPEESHGEGT